MEIKISNKPAKLSDIIKDSIVVVTNNINDISGAWVAKQYQADDFDEIILESTEEIVIVPEKFIINKEEVNEVLDYISNCRIDIVNRRKNNQFKKRNTLNNEDIKSIMKQLSVGDYSYNVNSNNLLHLGKPLAVFITGKEFVLSDGRTLNNLVLYIKVDYSEEGWVTVISIHESSHPEEESHPYVEEFKEYENLWSDY